MTKAALMNPLHTVDVKFFATSDPFARGAAAQQLTTKSYSYYVTPQQASDLAADPKKYELAVVQAPGDDGGFKVVRIVGVPSDKPASAEKHIISLVSLTEFRANLAKVEEAKRLRARINQRANEIAEEARLRALASEDPTMQDLLKQLEDLKA